MDRLTVSVGGCYEIGNTRSAEGRTRGEPTASSESRASSIDLSALHSLSSVNLRSFCRLGIILVLGAQLHGYTVSQKAIHGRKVNLGVRGKYGRLYRERNMNTTAGTAVGIIRGYGDRRSLGVVYPLRLSVDSSARFVPNLGI